MNGGQLMKDKIKNGYFFKYDDDIWMRVGSRCYWLPLRIKGQACILFKYIDEEGIQEVFKPNGERVE